MKNFKELIKENNLETFVESFYPDEETNVKLKNILNESLEQPKYKLNSVKRIILIGVEFSESIKRFKKDGIKVEYANPEDFKFDIKENEIKITSCQKVVLIKESDCIDTIVLMRSGYTDKNIAFVLQRIEDLGILILNPVEPVAVSANKFNTAQLLSKYDIAQPKYCLLTSNDVTKSDHEELDKKLKQIYPKINDDSKFVCKILEGHGGKGVFLCRKSNILSICQCIFKLNDKTKILIQEFKEIDGGDIRVNIVTLNGKQEIFNVTMRQKTSSDFRTNLSLGNTVKEDIKLTAAQEQLARRAAKASGLIWAGVDLMPCKDGNNYIIEINGAAGPMSDINDDDSINTNYNFYNSLIKCINDLC